MGRKKRRVLVVEDDRAVAKVHCRYMRAIPGNVVVGVAQTAPQVRALVDTLHPDLVLLDLELPGVGGLELLRELRRDGWKAEVIVVSAHTAPEMVHACIQLGVVDYLVKPFWPRRLGEALALIDEREATLGDGGALDQDAVDRLRGIGADARLGPAPSLKPERVALVRSVLAEHGLALSAEEVAEAAGMSRVTARRYLEHLVAGGQCTVDTDPEGPGRPRKFYRLWLSTPVGGSTGSTRSSGFPAPGAAASSS
jgi:response regulator of citrate/malate metabolism